MGSAQMSSRAPSSQARIADIGLRLSELGKAFAANVAAATADFTLQIPSEAELAGMSPREAERARQKAASRGLEGFSLTLDAPSYQAAIGALDHRALRKTLYEAFYTRASDRGPRAGRFDNTPLVGEMLELRHELALLHGFRNYAELALRDGVLPDPDDAERRLVWEHRATRALAQSELDGLWEFAKAKGVPRGFSNWDLPYYAAWRAREEFSVSEAELSEHFELGAALRGAVRLAEERLGLRFAPASKDEDPSSGRSLYQVFDSAGALLGQLAFEAFAQEERLGEERVALAVEPGDALPTARVQCGFEASFDASPVLLSHAALEALFRSLGRALFLLLTRTPAGSATLSHGAFLAGEVAAHYFERFSNDFDSLSRFARHHASGLEFSRELFEKLVKKKALYSGLYASQELELSLFDLRVHRDHVPLGKSTQLRVQVLDTFTQIRREQSVLPAPYWTRIANICAPIFVEAQAARLWERDWARRMGAELFHASREGSADALRSLRDFWAAGERSVASRLEAALGRVPAFGAPAR